MSRIVPSLVLALISGCCAFASNIQAGSQSGLFSTNMWAVPWYSTMQSSFYFNQLQSLTLPSGNVHSIFGLTVAANTPGHEVAESVASVHVQSDSPATIVREEEVPVPTQGEGFGTPEPAYYALIGFGLVALSTIKRRQARKRNEI